MDRRTDASVDVCVCVCADLFWRGVPRPRCFKHVGVELSLGRRTRMEMQHPVMRCPSLYCMVSWIRPLGRFSLETSRGDADLRVSRRTPFCALTSAKWAAGKLVLLRLCHKTLWLLR